MRDPDPDETRASGFPPTLWTQVLAAGDALDPDRSAALESFARRYYKPILAFIRFEWPRDRERAEDLAQDFFAAILARDFFVCLDPAKGRFRAFLKTALRNFLAKSHRDARRKKRGGGARPAPLSEVEPFLAGGPDPARSAEEAFDRAWRKKTLSLGTNALCEELLAKNHETRWRVFELLVLSEPEERPSHAEVAERLGIKASDVNNHLHAARKRLREILRGLLLESLSDPRDLDSEWKEVIGRM